MGIKKMQQRDATCIQTGTIKNIDSAEDKK